MPDADEVVRCDQCGWPILRRESYAVLMDVCPDCGELEPVGAVHLKVCAYDKATGEPRARTQKRRMGLLGAN